MASQTQHQRRVVHYTGRVQGVGFRITTRHIAAGFPITGFVENLPDGRVRLVCEGPSQELDAFLKEVDSQLGRYVTAVQSSQEAANGEFHEFFIRR